MKTFKLDAQIYSFDYDGDWGKLIGPKSVAAWLKTLKDGEEAVIEINSPGGLVVSGLAIANSIKNSKAKITAHIVGIAASMASVVACACEHVVMEEGSMMMIHDPWAGCVDGNAEDLRKEADILDSMKQACMGFYRAKFDRTEEELAAMMSEETWWNGAEAQSKGFVCEVVKSDVKFAACACRFKNLPKDAEGFVKDALTPEAMAEIEKAVAARDAEDAFNERLAAAMRSRDTEINELKARLDASRDALDQAQAAAAAAKTEFENQIHALEQELETARADLTSLRERAENAETEFAQTRDQLERLNQAHASLMGGVLTPREQKPLRTAAEIAADATLSPEQKSKLLSDGDYKKSSL